MNWITEAREAHMGPAAVAELKRCQACLLNYWRNVRDFGKELTEEEHLQGLTRNGSMDVAWAIWQGALAAHGIPNGVMAVDGAQAAEQLREATRIHGHCKSCHALHPQHHAGCTAGVPPSDGQTS